jgi:hypothetical protein
MKYLITEDRLQAVFNKYMDEFTWEVEDFGDIAVFGNRMRYFDTFGDYLSINPFFLEKMTTLFGENAGDLMFNWFNENFEWESHPATDWGEAEFYEEENDEVY